MVAFPTKDGFFPAGAGNVGPVRAGQRGFYDAVRQLPGARAVGDSLVIAGGAVAPTQGVHTIDTEGAAATDDLTTIGQDTLPDGSMIWIAGTDAARVVTVKHGAGGAGQVLLADGADLALSSPTMYLVLVRDGTTWVEAGRFYGSQKAAFRAWLGLGSAAAKNTGTSGDVVPLLNATINMGDNILQRPEIKDPAETVQAVTSTAGALTVDYSAGQVATITLTEDVTAFNISDWPSAGKAGGLTIEITQHASEAKTFDWGNVDFGDVGEPDLSVVGSVHIVEIFTRDAGTTEYGVLAFSKTV